MPDNTDVLLETLREAQRLGFFGGGAIGDAVTHAQAFVAALEVVPVGAHLVDLGSGGGLPGLVVALARPTCAITLIDRREKRTDFLQRAVSRLGADHVVVRTGDVRDLIRDIERGEVPPADAVTARGFGPPTRTLTYACRLLARDGRSGAIVISEPPDGDRWDAELLDQLGLASERVGAVRRFRRTRWPVPRPNVKTVLGP